MEIIMDPTNTFSTIEEFLEIYSKKVQSPEYLKQLIQAFNPEKKIIKKNEETQLSDSNNQNIDVDIDILAALNMASKKDTACVQHTSHTMLNPNPSYQFANNPGMDACSHPVRLELVPANTLLPCQAPGLHILCSLYSPDYKIIKKFVSLTDSTLFYYLTKYRSLDGSYSYKIYDSSMNLYNQLSYKNLSDKNSDIDSYALDVFLSFVKDSMIQVEEVLIEQPLVEHSNPNKKSYLATLVS
jgi:hypothetical protein